MLAAGAPDSAAKAAACSRRTCSACWRSISSTRRHLSEPAPSPPERELALPRLRDPRRSLDRRFDSLLAAASSSVNFRRVTCRPSLCILTLTDTGGDDTSSRRSLLLDRLPLPLPLRRRCRLADPAAAPATAPAAAAVSMSVPVALPDTIRCDGAAGGTTLSEPSIIPPVITVSSSRWGVRGGRGVTSEVISLDSTDCDGRCLRGKKPSPVYFFLLFARASRSSSISRRLISSMRRCSSSSFRRRNRFLTAAKAPAPRRAFRTPCP